MHKEIDYSLIFYSDDKLPIYINKRNDCYQARYPNALGLLQHLMHFLCDGRFWYQVSASIMHKPPNKDMVKEQYILTNNKPRSRPQDTTGGTKL